MAALSPYLASTKLLRQDEDVLHVGVGGYARPGILGQTTPDCDANHMSVPLSVLLVEDSQDDAALICRELVKGGYEPIGQRVETSEELIRALETTQWEIVVSDYRLPSLSAPQALKILRDRQFDLPFIVVSGTIGEDVAVELMKSGVHDYVMKDNMRRLPGAVKRALMEAGERRGRQHAEEELRKSQERFRALSEAACEGIGVHEHGVLLDANRAFRDMFGLTAAEIRGKPLEDLVTGDSSSIIAQHVKTPSDEPYEVELRRTDGTLFDAEVSDRPMPYEGRTACVTAVRDITKRKSLEDQLRQAQKMEAVGRLAGGVAHDFNNLLTAISGYSELALMRLPEGDPLRHEITEISAAADRASRLTRQLLVFSRKQVIQPRLIDLNAVLTDLEKMLRRLIGEDIAFLTLLDHELGSIKADPGQIEQVVVNLAVNARDAMAGGGKLTIETANIDLDETYARIHVDARAGSYVLLAVSDNGCGMDAATLAQIFEPFFTTKSPDKGTGLGLSTVYGIVKQSGGFVSCYSEPGKGACFKIYLPRVHEMSGVAVAHSPQQTTLGSATVLLVEDEAFVRRVARECLEKGGHTVLDASNGAEALLICEHHRGPIQLMLTDVVMPGMSGRELAERLASLRPEMRILFTSGYTEDAAVLHGILEARMSFIQKPYNATALLRKVDEVIRGVDSALATSSEYTQSH